MRRSLCISIFILSPATTHSNILDSFIIIPTYWIVKRFYPIYWKIIDIFFYKQYNIAIMDKEFDFDIYSLDDNELKKAFGKTLKELRIKLNLTQKELSKHVQIPIQSISVYERGEICPTIIQAMRLSRFFNLSIDDFILNGLGYETYDINKITELIIKYLTATNKDKK